LGAGLRASPAGLLAMIVIVLLCGSLVASVLLSPLGLYLAVSWMLALQIILDERCGPIAALRRSRQVVRGQWWRACGIGCCLIVLYLFPGIVLAAVSGGWNSDVATSIAAGLAYLLSAPFLAVAHTQLYLDIRLRKGEPVNPTPPAERIPL
jgi:hypothetical protein